MAHDLRDNMIAIYVTTLSIFPTFNHLVYFMQTFLPT